MTDEFVYVPVSAHVARWNWWQFRLGWPHSLSLLLGCVYALVLRGVRRFTISREIVLWDGISLSLWLPRGVRQVGRAAQTWLRVVDTSFGGLLPAVEHLMLPPYVQYRRR
jgi:hypothetical protein